MARRIPAHPSRDRSRAEESVLLRSAESLGRMIGALQRQLEIATGRVAASRPNGSSAKKTAPRNGNAQRAAKPQNGNAQRGTKARNGAQRTSSASKSGARRSAKKR
jgi:hypothetical protein